MPIEALIRAIDNLLDKIPPAPLRETLPLAARLRAAAHKRELLWATSPSSAPGLAITSRSF